jgi:hypothetical protein
MTRKNVTVNREKNLKNEMINGKGKSNKKQIEVKTNHKLHNKFSNGKVNWIPVLFISFVIAIIPIILRMYIYDPKLGQYIWFAQMEEKYDFFLYFKQWTLVGVALLMVVIICKRIFKDNIKLKFSRIIIPLGIYILFIILSTIFSENIRFSLLGVMDQFESMFALLSYCIVVLFAVECVDTELDFIYILRFLLLGSLVLGALGVGQTYGYDFFYSTFVQKLIIPRNYWDYIGSFGATFGKGVAYLTLFNPNYVGVYVSLVIPILFVLLIFNKKIVLGLLYILAIVGLSISMVGSGSLAAIISLGFSAIALVIFLWRYLLKSFFILIPVLVIGVILIFSFNKINDNTIGNYLMTKLQINKSEHNISDITTYDDHVGITYKGNTLNIEFIYNDDDAASFNLTDGNGLPVENELVQEKSEFIVTDKRFPGFSYAPVVYNNYLSFYVKIDRFDWLFTNQTGDGTYYYHNRAGKLDKMVEAPSAIFTGYEWFASRRGYLWSRTIPLIKSNIIVGSGPDTFILEFPQYDYLNFYNYGYADQYNNQVVTKPHSLYLQIAVQTGLLSLFAFLAFYGMYFISSIKLFIRGRFNSIYAQAGLAIFVGTIGYMVSGIANDSSITTAPVFWALMGVGIAANYKAKPLILEEAAKAKEEKLAKKNKVEESVK